MKIISPTNLETTISDLALALTRLEDPNANPWVDKSFRQRLTQAESKLRSAHLAHVNALSLVKAASAERQLQGSLMIRTIRDFVASVNRTVQRQPESKAWQNLFRTVNGCPTGSSLNAKWLEKGRVIALAQAELEHQPELVAAIAAPPPSSPSAEEVASAYARANAADKAWRDAINVYKDQARQLRQQRNDAVNLLAGLRNRLKEGFRGLSEGERRDRMRTFGIRFAGDPKDKPDSSEPTPVSVNPVPTNQ